MRAIGRPLLCGLWLTATLPAAWALDFSPYGMDQEAPAKPAKKQPVKVDTEKRRLAEEKERLAEENRRLKAQLADAEKARKAEATKSVPKASVKPLLPAVEYIHGWSADRVQALQKQTAATLGMPVVGKPCPECLEEVVIPAGSFDMGGWWDPDGRSGYRVTISKPFALARTEVTQGQWKALMGNNPSEFQSCGDDCPVENVSWYDAQEFVKKLSQKTGQKYRLPSEAEWEFAARAGTKTLYWWGNEPSHEYMNYGGDNEVRGVAQGRDRWVNTAPVAQFPPNGFGLHDMHGNVSEWVQDCDHNKDAPKDGIAHECTDTDRAEFRRDRGGSWKWGKLFACSGFHSHSSADRGQNELGFRPARTLP